MTDGFCVDGFSGGASLREACSMAKQIRAEDMRWRLYAAWRWQTRGWERCMGSRADCGMFPAPHGAVCAALLARDGGECKALRERDRKVSYCSGMTGWRRWSREPAATATREWNDSALVAELPDPKLARMAFRGARGGRRDEATNASSMKANPIALTSANWRKRCGWRCEI